MSSLSLLTHMPLHINCYSSVSLENCVYRQVHSDGGLYLTPHVFSLYTKGNIVPEVSFLLNVSRGLFLLPHVNTSSAAAVGTCCLFFINSHTRMSPVLFSSSLLVVTGIVSSLGATVKYLVCISYNICVSKSVR